MTLDRLDTFSAACLVALTPPAPVSTNNLGKLRTWARYECGDSLNGEGLILCWNPWAVEGAGGCTSQPGPEGCGWAAIARYGSCAQAVAAVVLVWARDVPHIVANLQADGPWAAWLEAPILGDLAYWIHGSRGAAVYEGWGSDTATPTSGSPDPQWCPAAGCAGVTCGAGEVCVDGACEAEVVSCPEGYVLVAGTCQVEAVSCPEGWTLQGGVCVPGEATPAPGPGRTAVLVGGGMAAAAALGLVAAFLWPQSGRQGLAPG